MLSTLKTLTLATLLTLTAVSVNASEQNTNNVQQTSVSESVDVFPACASFPHCWPTHTGE
ncbi:hypothetical protein PRUB_a4176 [Pseudoalteromonas rubra]|uniref:Uncharacterized protein n=1 Tax=Pseudoalteromonas rubra TaxID=43658 RepID=A0A8T0C628_9GAMM|nr:hypothetical protein PRUB_a4176 [Pseudoalteromonas rubra]